MRLFFAVELPDEVRASVSRLRGDDGYRWVEPAQMHVTLAFLGEQPPDALARLDDIAAAAASESRPFALRLGAPGSFGPRSAPSVLWIGLVGDVSALTALQSTLATGLRAGGFQPEERPFRPHITLARRRANARAQPSWPPPKVPAHAFSVREWTLFQSQLSPKGATYIALSRYPLST